ncbi:hypothetical protein [Isoptericola variabilis]|uniref:Uncharacterized protein n=1 Tax=Isoptericola variabilis (strain 225) TaxID=743718 RepID=F6FX34_ISOV2|nr:hypothetical protein [Isoptericola variabilis]AEG44634.1 hypothetical protein Isova_1891 [Isoptericola variabilis 225]TWH28322.1 hypothetical protein L600_004100000120 [Isoptericola variabilis J7]
MAQLDAPVTAARRSARPDVWPAVLGAVAAVALVGAGWLEALTWRQLAAVLAAAGLVYLGSAALGSRPVAWWTFAVSVVVIGLGRWDVVDPLAVLLVLGVVLGVVGAARRARIGRAALLTQLAATAVTLVVAFLAAGLPAPWGGVVLAAGLLTHTAWDVAHHRADRVVPRSMAEFCAVLDALLAAGAVVLALR